MFWDILKDKSGQFSSARFMFVIYGVVILAVWTITSIVVMTMQSIPWDNIALLAALGGFKIVQKPMEK